MNKKILGIIALLSVLGLAVVTPALATPVPVPDPAPAGIVWSPTPPPAYTWEQFLQATTRVVNFLFGGVLVIAVIFIILSAYIFITAGGAPDKVTKARLYLIYALVGLAVALVVRGLISFMGHILNVPVTI